MAIIILTGGKSSRMGEVDKQFLPLKDGKTMLRYIIDKIRSMSGEIIVVDKDTSRYRGYSDLKVVEDIYDAGPLGGIHAGLKNSVDDYNFIMACDMPLINVNLVEYMFKVVKKEVLVPRIDSFLEPLHAIYHKNCVNPIETVIKEGKGRIISFYTYVEVEYLPEEEIRKIDPELHTFENINTREDYRRILNRIGRR